MKNEHDDDISNPSGNRPFEDVLEARLSRRDVLSGGLAVAASTFFGSTTDVLAAAGRGRGRTGMRHGGPLIDFEPVTVAEGTGPVPSISPDYQFQTIIPWGEPLERGGPEYVQITPNGATDPTAPDFPYFADLTERGPEGEVPQAGVSVPSPCGCRQ